MKATIDAARFEGRGYCTRFAPLVIDTDEDGYSRVHATGELDPEQVAQARLAASACPEQAVLLHE